MSINRVAGAVGAVDGVLIEERTGSVMHEDNELDAYRSSYIKVAQAAVKAIEACPAAISSGTPAGDSATVALLELAAALEESKATILKALSHG